MTSIPEPEKRKRGRPAKSTNTPEPVPIGPRVIVLTRKDGRAIERALWLADFYTKRLQEHATADEQAAIAADLDELTRLRVTVHQAIKRGS